MQTSLHADSQHPVIAFDGAISTSSIPHPSTPTLAFSYLITFHLTHPRLIRLSRAAKPPLHFHPYQHETIRVLAGRLSVDIGPLEDRVLTPADGEVIIAPWTHHRLYPPPREDGLEETQFVLSGEGTQELYRLDTTFFENWYGYQDEVVLRGGGKFDLVQVMAMFDAGGSYLSFPWWVPFGRTVSVVMGIVVGRWIGALLGYQPFYKKWTRDWDLACEKMETSFFQRRFAVRSKDD